MRKKKYTKHDIAQGDLFKELPNPADYPDCLLHKEPYASMSPSDPHYKTAYRYWLTEMELNIIANVENEDKTELDKEKEILNDYKKNKADTKKKINILKNHKKYAGVKPTVELVTEMLYEMLEIIQLNPNIYSIDSALAELSFPYSFYKAFLDLEVVTESNRLMSVEDFEGLYNIYQRCLAILRGRVKTVALLSGKSNAIAKHMLEIEHGEFADIKKLTSTKKAEEEMPKQFYQIGDIKIEM
jgi:hypothetical protein